jgi:hypothetical protein
MEITSEKIRMIHGIDNCYLCMRTLRNGDYFLEAFDDNENAIILCEDCAIAYCKLRFMPISKICFDIESLLVKKQKAYGKGNLNKFGGLGIIIRVSDKLNRITTLLEDKSKENDESIDDTVNDMIGYLILYKLMREGKLTDFELFCEEYEETKDEETNKEG